VSYDTPEKIRYSLTGGAAIQFGAAGETASFEFIGPKGKKGLVRDIEIEVTESMVGTTSVPEINVGDAASVAGTPEVEYARWRLGTAAGTGYATSVSPNPLRASSLVQGNPNEPGAAILPGRQSVRFSEHVVLEKAFIPADTPFFISLREGVDGAEAGAGRIAVEIDWF
jgi:hypothetical protein